MSDEDKVGRVLAMRCAGASRSQIRLALGLTVGQANGILDRNPQPNAVQPQSRRVKRPPSAERPGRAGSVWTPDFIDRVRQAALGSATLASAAVLFGLSPSALKCGCVRYGIKWREADRAAKHEAALAERAARKNRALLRSQRRSEEQARAERKRTARAAALRLSGLAPGERAQAELVQEIEAAKAEAATAPLYRGGWPA